MTAVNLHKGILLTLEQAAEVVFEITRQARQCGCIPIAAAILRPAGRKETWRLAGWGHNELGWGLPFIHGETGAFRAAGLIDYRDTLLLSSLSPCEFCQSCATHLGIKTVFYLDGENFIPDQSRFADQGIAHREIHHQPCCDHFAAWLEEDSGPAGRRLWHQDIGSYTPDPACVIDLERLAPAMDMVLRLMRYSVAMGEYPGAAVIVDAADYRIQGYGPGRILASQDPTAVPELFAGRQCGALTRWDRKIFVTSNPPSPIAAGMYRRWNVRNLVILNPEPVSGASEAGAAALQLQVTLAPAAWREAAAALVQEWRRQTDAAVIARLSALYGGVAAGL